MPVAQILELWGFGHPGLHKEFWVSLGHMRPCPGIGVEETEGLGALPYWLVVHSRLTVNEIQAFWWLGKPIPDSIGMLRVSHGAWSMSLRMCFRKSPLRINPQRWVAATSLFMKARNFVIAKWARVHDSTCRLATVKPACADVISIGWLVLNFSASSVSHLVKLQSCFALFGSSRGLLIFGVWWGVEEEISAKSAVTPHTAGGWLAVLCAAV